MANLFSIYIFSYNSKKYVVSDTKNAHSQVCVFYVCVGVCENK
jgi:hypothetical protein